MSTFDTGPAEERALRGSEVTEEQLLDAMGAGPVLVLRAIDGTVRDVRWCRASKAVLHLLDRLEPGASAKENGSPLTEMQGQRLS